MPIQREPFSDPELSLGRAMGSPLEFEHSVQGEALDTIAIVLGNEHVAPVHDNSVGPIHQPGRCAGATPFANE